MSQTLTPIQPLWLDPIPVFSRASAQECIHAGDAGGFLILASNDYGLDLVAHNIGPLLNRGIYEEALVQAFVYCRINNSRISLSALIGLFEIGDSEKFRALGSPLPSAGPFTLYRGVSGKGRARRLRGLSWTDDIEQAKWFAKRLPFLESPAVYEATFSAAQVIVFVDGAEREFIAAPDSDTKLKKVWSA